MIPDFSEFLASIDIDDVGKQIDELQLTRIYELQDNGLLTDPIVGLIQELYKNAIADANKIFFITLSAYHEWLKEHLEQC